MANSPELAVQESRPGHMAGPEKCAPASALIIADDIGIFLPIARSLGRASIDVDVATCGEKYPGLTSKYIREVHCLPPYLSAPTAWLEALQRLSSEKRYGLIFPSSDSSLGLLEAASQRIDRKLLAIPNQRALSAFADKASTRALAAANDVKVAQGQEFTVDSETFGKLECHSFPLVLKPSKPYVTGSNDAKTKVRIARCRQELAEGLTALMDREIVVEQFFAGEGVGVSVLAKNGNILHDWQHRRLAASSETGRSSRRIGQMVDKRLLRDVRKLTKAVSLTGVAMFEFRQDPVSGEHILLEVNPRFWGSLPLALASGANFPLQTWKTLTGSDAQIMSTEIDLSIEKTSLTAEFDRISDLLGQPSVRLGATFGLCSLLLQAIFRPARFDGWTNCDPRPHWSELHQIATRCWSAAVRRLAI